MNDEVFPVPTFRYHSDLMNINPTMQLYSHIRATRNENISPHQESITSRQEDQLTSKSIKDLQTAGSTGDPIERLRLVCLSKGAGGILALGRMFRHLDHQGHKQLKLDVFLGGLREIGMEVSREEARDLFACFDTDETGGINMEDFLVAIRPPMSGSRVKIINEAFNKMDKTKDGVITIEDLRNCYNVKAHPRYMSGEESKENVLKFFLEHFIHDCSPDGKVTKEEFLNYYSAISAAVEDDCYFDLVIRQEYKL